MFVDQPTRTKGVKALTSYNWGKLRIVYIRPNNTQNPQFFSFYLTQNMYVIFLTYEYYGATGSVVKKLGSLTLFVGSKIDTLCK